MDRETKASMIGGAHSYLRLISKHAGAKFIRPRPLAEAYVLASTTMSKSYSVCSFGSAYLDGLRRAASSLINSLPSASRQSRLCLYPSRMTTHWWPRFLSAESLASVDVRVRGRRGGKMLNTE